MRICNFFSAYRWQIFLSSLVLGIFSPAFASTYSPGSSFPHNYRVTNTNSCTVTITGVTGSWNSTGGVLEGRAASGSSSAAGTVSIAPNTSRNFTIFNFNTRDGVGPGSVTSSVAFTYAGSCSGEVSAGGTTYISAPEFRITKVADSPVAGTDIGLNQEVRFTLTVSNNTASVASNVVITDQIDSRYEFIGLIEDPSIRPDGSGLLTIPVGNLASGASVSRTFLVRLTNVSGGNICNTANAASGSLRATSNTVCHGLLSSDPNFIIEKFSDPVPNSNIARGLIYTYRLTVRNTGSTPISNAVLTDVLDSNLRFNHNRGYDSISNSGQTVTVNFGTLDAGEVDSVLFDVQVQNTAADNSQICNLANGRGQRGGSAVSSQSNQICHPVNGVVDPDLGLLKSASNPPAGSTVAVGQTIDYTIATSNTGSDGLTNTNVTDLLDDRLEFVRMLDSGTINQSGQHLTFPLGALPAGTTQTRTFQVRVSGNTGSQICNRAQVSGMRGSEFRQQNSNLVCHNVSTTPHCGNGVVESPEQCDDGNTVSGDGCSATCQSEGGGGGGGGGEKTVGTCSVHSATGALQCVPRKPVEDVDNPAWQEYRDCRNDPSMTEARCLAAWADYYEYRVCGGVVGGAIAIPHIRMTTENLVTQCAPEVPIGGCETSGCPGCFGLGTFIEKKTRQANGTWANSSTIVKGLDSEYKVRVSLGTHDRIHYRILGGKVKIYDMTVPTESGNIWNRHGISDASSLNDGRTWAFVDGIDSDSRPDHFERTMSPQEISQLNVGGYEFALTYKMDSNLATTADVARIKNVAWAVVEYTYQNQVNGTTGVKRVGIGNNACNPRQYFSGSSLGDSATVNIIRPFIQAKKGGNLGFDFDENADGKITGNKEKIVSGVTGVTGATSTTGKVVLEKDAVDKGDRNFLFDYSADLIQKITDFVGVKSFQGKDDRDTFFENLKQNAFSEESHLGKDWKTTFNNSGIYFLESEDLSLALPDTYDLDEQSKTFVIESGDLVISSDFTVENGFVSFIVRDGDVYVDKSVSQIDGIFIVEKGVMKSKDDKLSAQQLILNGAVMGDMDQLLEKRIFIGSDPDNKLEPNIEINFDLRILENTPPALEQFLGDDWKESME